MTAGKVTLDRDVTTWPQVRDQLLAQQAHLPPARASNVRYGGVDYGRVRQAAALIGDELELERRERVAARDARAQHGRPGPVLQSTPTRLQPVPSPWPADDPRSTRRWTVIATPKDKTLKPRVETVRGDHRLDLAYGRLERDPAYSSVAARPA